MLLMANKLVGQILPHLLASYSIMAVTRSLPVIENLLSFFLLFDVRYFSLCHSWMLLCGAAQPSSLADVLVLYVFIHSVLLRSLANVCLGKTSIWKVTTSMHGSFLNKLTSNDLLLEWIVRKHSSPLCSRTLSV
jgi:hypothetical protein